MRKPESYGSRDVDYRAPKRLNQARASPLIGVSFLLSSGFRVLSSPTGSCLLAKPVSRPGFRDAGPNKRNAFVILDFDDSCDFPGIWGLGFSLQRFPLEKPQVVAIQFWLAGKFRDPVKPAFGKRDESGPQVHLRKSLPQVSGDLLEGA